MARGEWNAARDGQFGWLAKSAGFRRNPQEHAGTGKFFVFVFFCFYVFFEGLRIVWTVCRTVLVNCRSINGYVRIPKSQLLPTAIRD